MWAENNVPLCVCLEERGLVALCVSVCRREGGSCVSVYSIVEIVHQMSGFLSSSVDFLSSMKGNGDNWSDFHQHIKEIVGNLFSEGLLKYMVMWWAGRITHELCSSPRCLVGTPRGPVHSLICKVWLSSLSLSLFLPLSSPLRIHGVPQVLQSGFD